MRQERRTELRAGLSAAAAPPKTRRPTHVQRTAPREDRRERSKSRAEERETGAKQQRLSPQLALSAARTRAPFPFFWASPPPPAKRTPETDRLASFFSPLARGDQLAAFLPRSPRPTRHISPSLAATNSPHFSPAHRDRLVPRVRSPRPSALTAFLSAPPAAGRRVHAVAVVPGHARGGPRGDRKGSLGPRHGPARGHPRLAGGLGALLAPRRRTRLRPAHGPPAATPTQTRLSGTGGGGGLGQGPQGRTD